MKTQSAPVRIALWSITLALFAAPVSAHVGHEPVDGFVSGALHPLSGLDHVVAMVAVGLWAAFLGRRAMQVLPVVFPALMILGGVFGMTGIAMPAVETVIGLSAVVLGLLIVGQVRLPLAAAAAVVGSFALFHGHAHGTELPLSASPVTYAFGFVLSTLLLHGIGIAAGVMLHRLSRPVVARALGAGIAAVGLTLLVS